ncbi:unnamed protein product, partial [Mesorhabditis belari]|uniref:Serine hydrolase domain-containing protein n=1 Tax=Mesorhabditis belari TaxID=2138241 RepID=A0AAF3FGF9_9BILA
MVTAPPTASTSKLKILCLHGYRQNDVFFREKTGGMRKMFKKFADFHFVNAPHVPSVTSEDRGEVRGWWFSRPDDHFSSKDVTDLFTGFDQSVQLILDTIANDGPFDGVLGFSQGASMLHLLLAKAQLGEISLPIDFVILASGFKSLSTQHKAYLDVKIEKPSLHMYGIGDEVVAYTISEKLAENFEEPTKIVHDGGHFIPPMSKYKTKFAEFLEKQLERKLE